MSASSKSWAGAGLFSLSPGFAGYQTRDLDRRLLRSIKAGQHTSLVAPHGYGKTTLLRKLHHTLQTQHGHAVFYIDGTELAYAVDSSASDIASYFAAVASRSFGINVDAKSTLHDTVHALQLQVAMPLVVMLDEQAAPPNVNPKVGDLIADSITKATVGVTWLLAGVHFPFGDHRDLTTRTQITPTWIPPISNASVRLTGSRRADANHQAAQAFRHTMKALPFSIPRGLGYYTTHDATYRRHKRGAQLQLAEQVADIIGRLSLGVSRVFSAMAGGLEELMTNRQFVTAEDGLQFVKDYCRGAHQAIAKRSYSSHFLPVDFQPAVASVVQVLEQHERFFRSTGLAIQQLAIERLENVRQNGATYDQTNAGDLWLRCSGVAPVDENDNWVNTTNSANLYSAYFDREWLEIEASRVERHASCGDLAR